MRCKLISQIYKLKYRSVLNGLCTKADWQTSLLGPHCLQWSGLLPCAMESIGLKPSVGEKLECSSGFGGYFCTHIKFWIYIKSDMHETIFVEI